MVNALGQSGGPMAEMLDCREVAACVVAHPVTQTHPAIHPVGRRIADVAAGYAGAAAADADHPADRRIGHRTDLRTGRALDPVRDREARQELAHHAWAAAPERQASGHAAASVADRAPDQWPKLWLDLWLDLKVAAIHVAAGCHGVPVHHAVECVQNGRLDCDVVPSRLFVDAELMLLAAWAPNSAAGLPELVRVLVRVLVRAVGREALPPVAVQMLEVAGRERVELQVDCAAPSKQAA